VIGLLQQPKGSRPELGLTLRYCSCIYLGVGALPYVLPYLPPVLNLKSVYVWTANCTYISRILYISMYDGAYAAWH
jgi:hypothetical protein